MADSDLPDKVLKLIQSIIPAERNEINSSFISFQYELFLKTLSCRFSTKIYSEPNFIIFQLKTYVDSTNPNQVQTLLNWIERLKNMISSNSLNTLLIFLYEFIQTRECQVFNMYNKKYDFQFWNHLSIVTRPPKTDTSTYNRKTSFNTNSLDNAGIAGIKLNTPLTDRDNQSTNRHNNFEYSVMREDKAKITQTLTSRYTDKEVKEFVSKEVKSTLGSNPHLSPWVLINDTLPDGQKESDLISELIYVIQGIDGLFISYNFSIEKYNINPKLDLPQPVKALIFRICELGYLYRHLNDFCSKSDIDKSAGLVKQSFTLSVKSYLDEYICLMAMIDSELLRELKNSSSLTTGLPHIMVLTLESLRKFMYLFSATKKCEGHVGGALISVIYKFSVIGEPLLFAVGQTLLNEAAKPMNRILTEWITEGNLSDPFNEFFISVDFTVKNDKLWSLKYNTRPSMIPSFISTDLVHKILRIGKSINFIKIICESEYKSASSYGMLNIQPIYTPNEYIKVFNKLSDVVDQIDSTISKHVLKILFEDYKLLIHLDAMFRYLMLAQGDFIRHLMELLKPYLSNSADSLHLNNMTSILESAINSTNAQFDPKEVLQRLDCKLAQSSQGDLGWDVFTLYYHTRGPLQVVVDYKSVDKYLKIFHFLWFIKRTVHLMDDLSKDQIVYQKEYKNIQSFKIISKFVVARELFHRINLTKTEMLHFINQLEYFITFEVLECSRAKLLQQLKNSSDLDDIIKSHDNYLDNVISLCLLNPDSE
ncbi:hypothetical protein HZS_426, partial [Henneguya salminicola]